MAIDKLLTNTVVALAVTEATAGTYLEPTVANVKLYDVEPITVDTTPTRIGNEASGNFQKAKYVTGVRRASTSFKAHLQSSGTPTVAPALKALLEASGGIEITDPTNIGYEWNGTPTCGTLSFRRIEYDCGPTPEGSQMAMRGAVANLTISAANVGAPIELNFALNGVNVAESDLAAAAPITPSAFDTTDCEKFLAAPFDLGGQVYEWVSFELNIQAEINALQDGGNADGIDQMAITDYDIMLNAVIRNIGVATKDWQAEQLADTVYATATVSLADWDFTFTGLQTMEQSLEDGDGFSNRNLSMPVQEFKMVQK